MRWSKWNSLEFLHDSLTSLFTCTNWQLRRWIKGWSFELANIRTGRQKAEFYDAAAR